MEWTSLGFPGVCSLNIDRIFVLFFWGLFLYSAQPSLPSKHSKLSDNNDKTSRHWILANLRMVLLGVLVIMHCGWHNLSTVITIVSICGTDSYFHGGNCGSSERCEPAACREWRDHRWTGWWGPKRTSPLQPCSSDWNLHSNISHKVFHSLSQQKHSFSN